MNNPFEHKNLLVFCRYSQDRRLRNKNFDVVHSFADSDVLKMSVPMYIILRNWLILRPFLSLVTEIQIITPRAPQNIAIVAGKSDITSQQNARLAKD